MTPCSFCLLAGLLFCPSVLCSPVWLCGGEQSRLALVLGGTEQNVPGVLCKSPSSGQSCHCGEEFGTEEWCSWLTSWMTGIIHQTPDHGSQRDVA
jgi:hypothetical protein